MKWFANLRKRYPTAVGVGVGVMLAAGAAVAAFLVYTGVNGSTSGNFDTSSTTAAITLTGGTPSGPLDPGASITVSGITEQNNNPSAQETLVSLTPTITTKNSSGTDDSATCASHLTVPASSYAYLSAGAIAAGASKTPTGAITVTADSTLPGSCASGTFSVNWTGATSP